MMAHPSLCSDATDVGRSIDVVSDYSSVASSGYAYGLGANVLLSVSSTRSMRHEVGMATAREYRRANSDTTTQTWRTPRAPVSQRRHSVPARLDHSNTWNPSFMDATVRALLKCNRRSIPRKHTLHSGGGGGGGGDAKRSKAQRVSGQHSLSPHSASRGKKGIAPNARNSPVRDVQERDAAPRVASRRPSANAKRAANAKPLPDSQQQSNAPTKRNSQSAPEGPNSERSGSTLPAKCKFCNVIVPRKEVLTHNLICPLKTFQCNLKDSETGEKCLVFCRGKDMLAEHQARCSYRRHICANEGCKRQVSVRSTSLHLAGCEYRRATCSQCGASYPRIQHDAHLLVCPEVLVQCPLLCGQVMRRETVPHHMLTEAAEHAIVPFPDPRVCGSDSGRMTTALLARLIQRNGDAEAVLREYTDHIRNHSPREQPLKKEEREHSSLERSSSGSARDSSSRKREEKQSASVKPDSRAAVEITPTASLDVDPLHTVSLSPPRDDGHAATSALKVAPAPKPQGSPASLGLPPPSSKRRLSTTTGERTNSAPVVAQQLALSPPKLSLSKVEPVPNVSAPSPTVIRKVRTSNASPHQAPIKGVAESKRTNGTSAFAAPLEERSTSTGSTATTTGSIATLEVNQNSRLRSKSNNSTSSPLLDPRVRRGSSSGLKCAADAETAATVVPRPTARSLSNSLRQSDEMSDSSTDNSARGQENVELASIAKTIARRERKLEKLFSALDEFCDNSNEPFRSGQNGHGSAADSEDRGKARLKARSEKMEKKMGDIDRRVKSLMSRESTLNLNNTLHVVDAWRQLESRWYTIKLLYHDALDITFNPKTLRASRMVDGTAAAACLLNSLKLQHGGILVAQRHATASSSMSISQVSVQRRLVSSSKIRPRVVNALQEEEEAAEDDPPLRRGDALSQQQQQQGRKLHRRKDADDDNEDGDGVDWERSDLESTENLVDLGEQEGGEEEWLQPTVRGESGAEELDGSVEEDESDDQLTSTGNERIRKGEQQVEDEDEIDEEEREDDTAAKEIHVDDRLLTERFPEYAEEYDSCNDIPVEKILVDSAKVVTWNCSECLTQWPCAVFIRCTLRTKCPTCTDSKTSALAMYPGVVDRWDQARNDPLVDPMQLPANSKTKAFWLCSVCNNSFKESASTAVAKRVICPQCRLTRTAHHALSREFLMREWHPLKNGDLDPSSVQDTDKTKVWWLCSACGEEWNTTFYNRRSSRRMNKGKYCPACRNLALLET